ncbi:hypothetical protein [Pseudodonghicola flavimaris]|uniref:PsiF repeat-containing protein n=1 Tax=Pseudodonghicola flavimaris TaxID=3050036 RepID=A0ABT7F133_9RHOB|nr:hypothetical protein [Pseudodonghicola flavimaris]MDK3018317.1 hypothetical protein [Pseudodonghicola flavimaris]
MFHHLLPLAGALALSLCAGLAAAQEGEPNRTAQCRAEAQKLSGCRAPLLQGEAGGVTFRLSGSVSLGVSKSRGGQTMAAPPFAGAASSERREAQRQKDACDLAQRFYESCMTR